MTQKTIQVDVEKDDFYDRIAQAAKAQLGVYQDCTMLVTNALKAVGINFHGWPEEYLSLGDLTNDPVPGDIVVYSRWTSRSWRLEWQPNRDCFGGMR